MHVGLLALTIALLSACADKAVVTATAGLYMRNAPSVEAGQVALLPAGAEVEILEEGPEQTINGVTGHWKRIKHNSTEGWVFGAYLIDSSNSEALDGFRKCTSRGGYWHSEQDTCYPARLRKLSENGRVTGPCGLDFYTLLPNGKIRATGIYYDGARMRGHWSFEDGNSIVLNLGGGDKYRARLHGDTVLYEAFMENRWSSYPLPGNPACP